MSFYQFIIGKDGIQIEDLGDVPLSADSDAFAFTDLMIRDYLRHSDAERYVGCTMNITEGERTVGSVSFEIKGV
jgi:hypothetical protein